MVEAHPRLRLLLRQRQGNNTWSAGPNAMCSCPHTESIEFWQGQQYGGVRLVMCSTCKENSLTVQAEAAQRQHAAGQPLQRLRHHLRLVCSVRGMLQQCRWVRWARQFEARRYRQQRWWLIWSQLLSSTDDDTGQDVIARMSSLLTPARLSQSHFITEGDTTDNIIGNNITLCTGMGTQHFHLAGCGL
jgi:hypothetical protein